MKRKDLCRMALKNIRPGFGTAYIIIIALCVLCLYLAGEICLSVQREKGEPCELTVTGSSYVSLNDESVADILELEDVLSATGCIEFTGTVTTGDYTAALSITGISGDSLEEEFTSGGLFPADTAMPWLILSEAALELFANPDGTAKSTPSVDWLEADYAMDAGTGEIPVGVCGIFAGEKGVAACYMDLSTAKSVLQQYAYTSIRVRIVNIGAAEGVSQGIQALGYAVAGMDAARQDDWTARMKEALYLSLLGLALLCCAVLVCVNNRFRYREELRCQAGALRWAGMPARQTQAFRRLQVGILSVLGAICGVCLRIAFL